MRTSCNDCGQPRQDADDLHCPFCRNHSRKYAHTPGPWRVLVTENCTYKGESRTGYVITPSAKSLPEEFGNARLISAALELLDALSITRGQWIDSVNAQQCLDALAKAGFPQPPKGEVV